MTLRNSVSFAATAICLCVLAACAGEDTLAAKSTSGRAPQVADLPTKDETVRGDNEPPIVVLNLGNALKEHKLSHSEPLPNTIIVPPTNLNAVPVTMALQAVLAGTDISLSWEAKALENHLVSVANLSGSLPTVVEKICSSAHVFCSFRHGLLELREKETFIIELPAVPDRVSVGSSSSSSSSTTAAAANSMADSISSLAGDKVKVDRQGGNLIYTTDVEGQETVREYLDQLRNGRPLVVLQLYIWEVTLNKENATGINWTNFSVPKLGGNWQSLLLTGTSGFTSISSPGVTMGATLSGKVNASAVLQFLSTQGSVQTISNPQLTFVSGSDAEFRVGGKQKYVSQVGLSSSVSGTTSTTSTTSSSVTTDTIETGLTVNVSGAFEDNVIVANLGIFIQNLVKMNSVTTSDTQIQLPVTTDRKIATMVRVRPGDNLVLAGMVSSSDSNSNEGLPMPFGLRAQTYGDDTITNSELVVMARPSVVLFSDKQSPEKAKEKPQARSEIQSNAGPSNPPVQLSSVRQPAKKENEDSVMVYPVADEAEETKVSQGFMQEGFAKAVDPSTLHELAVSQGGAL